MLANFSTFRDSFDAFALYTRFFEEITHIMECIMAKPEAWDNSKGSQGHASMLSWQLRKFCHIHFF